MTLPTPPYAAQDLDRPAMWQAAQSRIASVDSTNFAVYFDHDQASAAIDLNSDGLGQWTRDHDTKPGTKWIHFWADRSQRPLIEAVASKYNLSPRLIGLLCTQAGAPSPPTKPDSFLASKQQHTSTSRRRKTCRDDLESTVGTTQLDDLSARKPDPKNISFGDIVNDLWHFHSVDWDHNYMHVGVNVLAAIPDERHASDKPAGRRLWTSIVLCHDGTVISTLERPHLTDKIPDVQAANKLVKRHILNIFAQVSRLAENSDSSNIMNIRIRPEVAAPDASTPDQSQRMEYASLLFYYLFDDWVSTYSLIARREHPYRDSLEEVRHDLTRAPDVHLLETLHDLGRQLNVLRLMYQSYATVVTRLLARYRRTWPPMMTIPHGRQAGHTMQHDNTVPSPMDFNPPLNFPHHQHGSGSFHNNQLEQPHISPAAIFRFERLLDRINLYALSEIEQCISEKESLDFMTFNLLGLFESRTVEKLTRTTVLLAKVTIVFLPISLQTAYFSIQVGNIEQTYTLKSYWLSFLVVAVVSFVFLTVFSLLTETVQGQLLYKSIHRVLWGRGVAKVTRKKTAGR